MQQTPVAEAVRAQAPAPARERAGSLYLTAGTVAGVFALLAVVVAVALDLPLRDPDGMLGPSYVRLPVIGGALLVLDVLPRALWRMRRSGLVQAVRDVVRERWPLPRFLTAVAGLTSFYVTYVAYRNLKSFLPFVRDGQLYDDVLAQTDLWFGFGTPPGEVLHAVLGTGVSAHVLSAIYVGYLFFVPLSLAVALVADVDARRSAFYVTALCLNWVLGTVSYYVLPSLGPVYSQPSLFYDLPTTGTSRLQASLANSRVEVLADPHATDAVHGIAAFGSLHTSVVFTAALVCSLLKLHRAIRWTMWAFFATTVLATIYFGWHFVLDDVAGVLIGLVSIAIGYVAARPVLGQGAGSWTRQRSSEASPERAAA